MKQKGMLIVVGVVMLAAAGWVGATQFQTTSTPTASSPAPAVAAQPMDRRAATRCDRFAASLRHRKLSDPQLRRALRNHPDCPAVVVDSPPASAAGQTRVVTLPPAQTTVTSSAVAAPSGGYENESEHESEGYEHEEGETD
ncbi:MAG TPA: hypothetical protein VFK89_04500 [Actinomycetota bacterium]|nr:hypothetical protein [Actinomycetota bacterium]